MNFTYNKNRNINSISPISNLFLGTLFTLVCIICIIPMMIVISSSFTPDSLIVKDGYGIIPRKPTITAYAFVFSDGGKVVRAYIIQILSTVIGTSLGVLITAMLAYPLSRRELPYRNFFAFFVFFTLLFNGGLAPTYYVYTRVLHLKNTFWILFIPLLVVGFNVIILRTFFTTNVSSEIIESAKIDGSGDFRTFFKIVFPISLPGIAAISLFTTVLLWNDWFLSMLYIEDEKLVNLQYLMYRTLMNIQYIKANEAFRQSYGADILAKLPVESTRMAMAMIGMGPILMVYPFFQKYFIKGLTIGAIKG